MDAEDSSNELNLLQQVHHELQQYYALLQLMRTDLEKITNNFTALNDIEAEHTTTKSQPPTSKDQQ